MNIKVNRLRCFSLPSKRLENGPAPLLVLIERDNQIHDGHKRKLKGLVDKETDRLKGPPATAAAFTLVGPACLQEGCRK